MGDVFDTAALRQAAEMPWPKDFREQSRLWAQNASDLAAAADYIDELEAAVAGDPRNRDDNPHPDALAGEGT